MTTTETALTCPECGRTFTRPASLGAHRNRAHGVNGSSPARTRARRTEAKQTTGARAARARQAKPTTRSRVRTAPPAEPLGDRLLRMVFGDVMPANEATLHAASSWVDEARRLADSTS